MRKEDASECERHNKKKNEDMLHGVLGVVPCWRAKCQCSNLFKVVQHPEDCFEFG
jgi:hypothetical protein